MTTVHINSLAELNEDLILYGPYRDKIKKMKTQYKTLKELHDELLKIVQCDLRQGSKTGAIIPEQCFAYGVVTTIEKSEDPNEKTKTFVISDETMTNVKVRIVTGKREVPGPKIIKHKIIRIHRMTVQVEYDRNTDRHQMVLSTSPHHNYTMFHVKRKRNRQDILALTSAKNISWDDEDAGRVFQLNKWRLRCIAYNRRKKEEREYERELREEAIRGKEAQKAPNLIYLQKQEIGRGLEAEAAAAKEKEIERLNSQGSLVEQGVDAVENVAVHLNSEELGRIPAIPEEISAEMGVNGAVRELDPVTVALPPSVHVEDVRIPIPGTSKAAARGTVTKPIQAQSSTFTVPFIPETSSSPLNTNVSAVKRRREKSMSENDWESNVSKVRRVTLGENSEGSGNSDEIRSASGSQPSERIESPSRSALKPKLSTPRTPPKVVIDSAEDEDEIAEIMLLGMPEESADIILDANAPVSTSAFEMENVKDKMGVSEDDLECDGHHHTPEKSDETEIPSVSQQNMQSEAGFSSKANLSTSIVPPEGGNSEIKDGVDEIVICNPRDERVLETTPANANVIQKGKRVETTAMNMSPVQNISEEISDSEIEIGVRRQCDGEGDEYEFQAARTSNRNEDNVEIPVNIPEEGLAHFDTGLSQGLMERLREIDTLCNMYAETREVFGESQIISPRLVCKIVDLSISFHAGSMEPEVYLRVAPLKLPNVKFARLFHCDQSLQSTTIDIQVHQGEKFLESAVCQSIRRFCGEQSLVIIIGLYSMESKEPDVDLVLTVDGNNMLIEKWTDKDSNSDVVADSSQLIETEQRDSVEEDKCEKPGSSLGPKYPQFQGEASNDSFCTAEPFLSQEEHIWRKNGEDNDPSPGSFEENVAECPIFTADDFTEDESEVSEVSETDSEEKVYYFNPPTPKRPKLELPKK